MSAGDLENIMETETPPQSPALFSSQSQPLMFADDRRGSVIAGVDDDVVCNAKTSDRHRAADDDNTLPVLKSPVSADQIHSPVSSLPSSPRPDSPVAFSVCPLRLGKTFAFSSADSEARPATMTAETFIQRQREQVGRIAEYNKRDSLIDEAHLAVSFMCTVAAITVQLFYFKDCIVHEAFCLVKLLSLTSQLTQSRQFWRHVGRRSWRIGQSISWPVA